MHVTRGISRHHGRKVSRTAIILMQDSLKEFKEANHEHVQYSCGHCEYLNMKVPIIHVSNYIIVRNVMQLKTRPKLEGVKHSYDQCKNQASWPGHKES